MIQGQQQEDLRYQLSSRRPIFQKRRGNSRRGGEGECDMFSFLNVGNSVVQKTKTMAKDT